MKVPEGSWWHQRHRLEKFAKTFESSVRLKLSPSWMGSMAKTFGHLVFIPADWTVSSAHNVIPHEVLGHVRQYRYCGFGIHPCLGFPLMFLLYIWGVIFPIYLAWGRYRLELHAETASWRYHLEARSQSAEDVLRDAERFASNVSGRPYLYAWPRSLTEWGFRRRAKKVIKKYLGSEVRK